MDKKFVFIIGAIILVLALILYWIFGGTDNEAEEQKPPQPPATNTVPSTQEENEKGNVSTDDLTQAQNESIKAFARDFTTKYMNYNPSKPTAHIESLKSVMADDLYQQQMALFKVGNPNIKSVTVKKIYVTDITIGEWYHTLTVPIDVTVATTSGQKVDATYMYIYNISQEKDTGWKMVGITDESDVHE